MLNTLQVVGLAGSLLLASFLYSFLTNPLRHFPGPWYTRITGAPWIIRALLSTRTHWVHRLHERYGPVVRVRPHELSITEEDAINKVLAVNGPFSKDPEFYDVLTTNTDYGSVFNYHDKSKHSRRRRILAAGFAKTNILRLEDFIVHKAKVLVDQFKNHAKSKQVTDVLVWHRYFASDAINKVAFDIDLKSVENGKQSTFVSDLDNLLFSFIIDAFFHPVLVAVKFFAVRFAGPENGVRKFLTAQQRCYDNFSTPTVAKYTANFDKSADKPELIAKLLKSLDDPSAELTMAKLTTELTDLNIAGTDTTSTTMTYLLWRLTQFPSWYNKLKEELTQAIPVAGELPSYLELEQLPILSACLKETLRIDAALPGPTPRRVGKTGTTVIGLPVAPNSVVSIQPYSVARDVAIWGKDASEWNPARWESVTKAQASSGFRTFGGGSTVCLGIHLAYAELYIAMAHVIRSLDFETAPGFMPDSMKQYDFNIGHPRDHKCLLVFKDPAA